MATGYKCPAAYASGETSELNLSSEEMPGIPSRINEALLAAIEKMKTKGMKSGDIVDKLIVSYCSRLDQDPKLSANDKAERVRRFASTLASVIYRDTANKEDDILVDVPVPVSLYGQLQRAAESANLNQDAWINQAIKEHLANP